MRAVGFFDFGGPEVLQVLDLPEVQAGLGEVRIRNYAATVNPTDLMARNGARAEAMKQDEPPYVPGMEVAGVVDQVGDGVVSEIQVGDHVLGIVVTKAAHGGYREQISLDARSVVRIPKDVSFPEACTLPMNGLTARQVLDRLNLSPGQAIAVTGGAGAFGGYVIQLAKLDGLTVIADAAENDVSLIEKFGADIVIRRGLNFVDEVRKHFSDGVDGLADGAVLRDKAVGAVKDSGAFSSVRGWEGNGERGIRFETTSVRSYAFENQKLSELSRRVEEGKLTLRVGATYKPEDAARAHERLEAGGTRGRLVIEF